MVHIILKFSDGESERSFPTTFDAYNEVLNAFNQCEEYFIGARLADDKEGKYISILDAEAYNAQVGPIKDYLEEACLQGFGESQLLDDIAQLLYHRFDEMLPSWKQHIEEYGKNFDEFQIRSAKKDRILKFIKIFGLQPVEGSIEEAIEKLL